MFKEEREECLFNWNMIGNIEKGRPNLGPTTSVISYRLLKYSVRDVLIRDFGVERADKIFYDAGQKSGKEFFLSVIEEKDNFDKMINDLQKKLKELGFGILRIEESDSENHVYVFAVAEDLDCSGLPVCDEEICKFDEGFLSGVLGEFFGMKFNVSEIDCWCSGDRVCRYKAVLI